MKKELCKKLKDLGFPQQFGTHTFYINTAIVREKVKIPTIDELIDDCGADFKSLSLHKGMWVADASAWMQLSSELSSDRWEAVARLCIKVRESNKK